jgi:hypothetical protein
MLGAPDFGGLNTAGSKTPTEPGTESSLKKLNDLARMLVEK